MAPQGAIFLAWSLRKAKCKSKRQLSDVLGEHPARPCIQPRLDVDRPQRPVVDILQRHRHDTGLTVDVDAAKELQSKTGGEIFALFRAAAFSKHRRRAERVIQLARCPSAGVKRTRDEFPERLEI